MALTQSLQTVYTKQCFIYIREPLYEGYSKSLQSHLENRYFFTYNYNTRSHNVFHQISLLILHIVYYLIFMSTKFCDIKNMTYWHILILAFSIMQDLQNNLLFTLLLLLKEKMLLCHIVATLKGTNFLLFSFKSTCSPLYAF